jgi:hypothetical protein
LPRSLPLEINDRLRSPVAPRVKLPEAEVGQLLREDGIGFVLAEQSCNQVEG